MLKSVFGLNFIGENLSALPKSINELKPIINELPYKKTDLEIKNLEKEFIKALG
jgi:hypothetical protein